jgi:hypothetical protein
MTEYEALRRFVFAQLTAAVAPILVFEDVVPIDQPLPAVIWTATAAEDTDTQDRRDMTEFSIDVKSIIEGDDVGAALATYALADAALHGAQLTYTDHVVQAYRTQPIHAPATESGKRYQQEGGRFAVFVRVIN